MSLKLLNPYFFFIGLYALTKKSTQHAVPHPTPKNYSHLASLFSIFVLVLFFFLMFIVAGTKVLASTMPDPSTIMYLLMGGAAVLAGSIVLNLAHRSYQFYKNTWQTGYEFSQGLSTT